MRSAYTLLALPLLVLPGCRMNEKMTGLAGGAAAGAAIGLIAGASAGTVLVLTGAGALTGYLIGDYLADQRCGSPCDAPSSCSPCAVPASRQVAVARTPVAPAATPTASGTAWEARVAYEKGRTAPTVEDAREAYEQSARLDPTRPEPWNALALLSVAQGDRISARAHLTKALALDPTYAPARHNLDRLDRGL
jgi:hypothetical protein